MRAYTTFEMIEWAIALRSSSWRAALSSFSPPHGHSSAAMMDIKSFVMVQLHRCAAFLLDAFALDMKWFHSLLVLSVAAVGALDGYTVPPGSPGYQFGNSSQIIQFDEHSLFINGTRTFIMSGEFHPWRIPVPELWSDVLQKMKVLF